MAHSGTRKCLHCQTFFKPTPRSKGRQKFCSHLECQKASKHASQKKWLKKPTNQHYFGGPENVQRVQRWREKNPGYSKKSRGSPDTTQSLQDTLIMQATEKTKENTILKHDPLQELLVAQPFVLIGLIAHLTGSALQDDIVQTSRKLQQLGEDFLHNPNRLKGEHDVTSSLAQPQPTTPSPPAV